MRHRALASPIDRAAHPAGARQPHSASVLPSHSFNVSTGALLPWRARRTSLQIPGGPAKAILTRFHLIVAQGKVGGGRKLVNTLTKGGAGSSFAVRQHPIDGAALPRCRHPSGGLGSHLPLQDQVLRGTVSGKPASRRAGSDKLSPTKAQKSYVSEQLAVTQSRKPASSAQHGPLTSTTPGSRGRQVQKRTSTADVALGAAKRPKCKLCLPCASECNGCSPSG